MFYRIKAGAECKVHSGIGEFQHTYRLILRRDKLFDAIDLIETTEESYTFRDQWGYDKVEAIKADVIQEAL